jgi:hypothetical protein
MLAASRRIIDCDREVFTQNFNRLPHEVQHSLAGHPLFQLPALATLAERVATREQPHHPKGDAHFDQGPGGVNQHDRAHVDIGELVREIEKEQAWVILKHIEREPGYREIAESCIRNIFDLTGAKILKDIKWFEASLFITSPNRVTNYHVDRECSWLLQIHGEKDFHLFDRADKDVLSDDELEKFWAVDNLAPTYKPQYESRAMVYRLRPGIGVHSPVNTPHWLQNGNNVSVSMNINFQFHDHAWANLFRANYHLRRVGLSPAPPGKYAVADRIKSRIYTAIRNVQHREKDRLKASHLEARQNYERIAEILALR